MIYKLAYISRRIVLPRGFIPFHKGHKFLFTNQKDDESSKKEEKVISV